MVGRFVGSFQCDQQCKDLVDEDLKTECEKQFCQQDEEEDYYDYNYDDSNEVWSTNVKLPDCKFQ